MGKVFNISLESLRRLVATELRYRLTPLLKVLGIIQATFLAMSAGAPMEDAMQDLPVFFLLFSSITLVLITSRIGIGIVQSERRIRLQTILPVSFETVAASRVALTLSLSFAVLIMQTLVWLILTLRGGEVDLRYNLTMNLLFFGLLQFYYCAIEMAERLPKPLTPCLMIATMFFYFILIRRVGQQEYLVRGAELGILGILNSPIFAVALFLTLTVIHFALFVRRRGLVDEETPVRF